jgi:trehalose/maltose hydrolase-like predicted phosphorylase
MWEATFARSMKGPRLHYHTGNPFGEVKVSIQIPSQIYPDYNYGTVSGRMAPRIEIIGPSHDESEVQSWIDRIWYGIPPGQAAPIGPYNLSNTIYNGHVFWDADVWMMPALALFAPERAKSILLYRHEKQAQAAKNFVEWDEAGRPNAKGQSKPSGIKGGLKFPWESAKTGKEVALATSRYEDHITGSVAWSQNYGAMLGIIPKAKADEIRKGAAAFYLARSEPSPEGRHIRAVMSPDENHIGDDDLYTNLLAQWCTGQKFYLPKDSKSLLTYEGDPVRSYKQAAAVLAIYPLQDPVAVSQAKVMMERFGDKTIPNGPAMSGSIHALIWARLGETERAYETWRDSWQPYKRGIGLMAEKRHKPETNFLTGQAGCLQTVLYGFCGFVVDWKPQPGALWSKQLKSGAWISIKPHLPAKWKSVTLNPVVLDGVRYKVEISPSQVNVTQGDR